MFETVGGNKENNESILADKMKYLTGKKLNKSDDKRIRESDKTKATLVDKEDVVYGVKFIFPSKGLATSIFRPDK